MGQKSKLLGDNIGTLVVTAWYLISILGLKHIIGSLLIYSISEDAMS